MTICIHSRLPGAGLRYWSDKQQHEIDFVWSRSRAAPPVAIECKWSVKELDPRSLLVFRRHYPRGENLVVAANARDPFTRTYPSAVVRFVNLANLIVRLESAATRP